MDECEDLDTAIEESIRICIGKGVLVEFLKRSGGEVVSFLYEALTTEECIAIREADGYRKGMEEGHAAGEREGAEKERLEIARNFKKAGIPMETIAENTGLTVEEIEKL